VTKKKEKDPLVEALLEGRSFTFTLPDGGSFHSMRMILKHGQSLTFSPIADYRDVEVGDIVLVKWRGGGYISHLVGEIQGDQFLIINSVGKVNGWVHGNDILGRVTAMTEPDLRPGVPEMLDQLESTYHDLIKYKQFPEDDVARFLSIVDDMRWYAEKIGPEHWDRLSQSSNRWSFEQHLWHLLKHVRKDAHSEGSESIVHLINHGKEHIGQVAEILSLFETDEFL
jgi:hypothetical protein